MLTLKEQIVNVVSRLSDQQQQEVLDFVMKLERPKGVPLSSLLDFVGSISAEDLKLMEAAIEEGFEKVNLDEW